MVLLYPLHPRNYIVLAMTESIREMIRVLQLTSPTEEEGALANATGGGMGGLPGGILPGTFVAKIFQAKELLSQAGKGVMIQYIIM